MNGAKLLRCLLAERCAQALRDCHALGLTSITLASLVVRDPKNAAMVVMVSNDPDPRAAIAAAMAPSADVIVADVPQAPR